MIDVIEVWPLAGYKLHVRFADGAKGNLDLEGHLNGPIFEPLKNKTEFDRVYVHPELHVLTWPNGADLSPEYTYEQTISC